MRERTSRIEKRWRWTALILGMVCFGIGCGPGTMLNFLMLPFTDDKVAPEYELKTTTKKDPTVALNTFFAQVEVRPELRGADADLNKRIAQHLQMRCKANRETIKVIDEGRSNQPASALFNTGEIAKRCDADFVINVEINSLSLRKEKSHDLFFEGKADMHVSVTRTEQGSFPEWEKDYRISFPETGPLYASDTSLAKFRGDFFEHIARDISRYFARYPREETLGMRAP